MIGERYGMLEIVDEAPSRVSAGQTKRYAVVLCDCGTEKEVRYTHLKQGRTFTCGCAKPGKRINGQSKTRLYDIWCCMKQRCYYPRSKAYPQYGAKGVVICEQWRTNFYNFYLWSMSNGYLDDLTIDRVNNAKIYSPETCEWVTLQENIRRRDVCKAGGRI